MRLFELFTDSQMVINTNHAVEKELQTYNLKKKIKN